MPTLSNELRQQIAELCKKHGQTIDLGKRILVPLVVNDLLDIFATQNTALLKEVATELKNKHLHSDSRAAELECSEDGYTYGLEDAMALINSKLAAMGEQ